MRGFTLIELMVTVAVLAILAAVAYPSYQTHIRRSHRVSAQAFLMDVATRQQQRFLDVRSYGSTMDSLQTSTPTEISGRYNVTIAVAAGPPAIFTITATPTGDQATDSCGTLSINQAGTKTPGNCW